MLESRLPVVEGLRLTAGTVHNRVLRRATEQLVEAIRGGVDRYAHPEAAASVAVVPGHFGGRAEIMGSLALAISRAADLA